MEMEMKCGGEYASGAEKRERQEEICIQSELQAPTAMAVEIKMEDENEGRNHPCRNVQMKLGWAGKGKVRRA